MLAWLGANLICSTINSILACDLLYWHYQSNYRRLFSTNHDFYGWGH